MLVSRQDPFRPDRVDIHLVMPAGPDGAAISLDDLEARFFSSLHTALCTTPADASATGKQVRGRLHNGCREHISESDFKDIFADAARILGQPAPATDAAGRCFERMLLAVAVGCYTSAYQAAVGVVEQFGYYSILAVPRAFMVCVVWATWQCMYRCVRDRGTSDAQNPWSRANAGMVCDFTTAHINGDPDEEATPAYALSMFFQDSQTPASAAALGLTTDAARCMLTLNINAYAVVVARIVPLARVIGPYDQYAFASWLHDAHVSPPGQRTPQCTGTLRALIRHARDTWDSSCISNPRFVRFGDAFVHMVDADDGSRPYDTYDPYGRAPAIVDAELTIRHAMDAARYVKAKRGADDAWATWNEVFVQCAGAYCLGVKGGVCAYYHSATMGG